MKQLFLCTECYSDKVQLKVWVNLNGPIEKDKIDFSASESGDAEDYWCLNCEKHNNCELTTIYEIGDEVNWTDPEGVSSGIYKVIKYISKEGDDSVYLISNSFSEYEVYAHELS